MAEKNNKYMDEIYEVMDRKTAQKEKELATERFTATADEFIWGNAAEEWAEKNKNRTQGDHMSKYDSIVEVAKTFDEIVEVNKFNPFHDKLGRFSDKNSFATYSANPKTTSGAKAITRSVDYKHGATINVHHESQGKTLDENAYWLKTGQKMPTADEPKAEVPAKKPKTQTKPKPEAETETQPKSKAFGNQEIQNGHEMFDKYGHAYGAKAVNFIKEATKCSDKEAEAMKDAITDFTDGFYKKIRGIQSGEIKPDHFDYDAYKKVGDDLESFIEKSPKWGPVTIYRGCHVDKKTADEIIKKAKAGEPLDQQGTASWSSDRSVSESFAHWNFSGSDTSILFVLKGGTMKGTSVKHLSEYQTEDEVLVSKTQRSKPTNVTKTNEGWIIECVELP